MRRLAVALLLVALAAPTRGWAASDDAPAIPPDVQSWADYTGIDAVQLAGAVWTVGATPEDYLVAEGVVTRAPAPQLGWPIGGALGQRIFCIEAIESRHGAAMWNPQPVWNGEHAQGWLGFLPSTARSVGVAIGNRASEWAGAAWMLANGRGREFAGVAMGKC